MHHYCIYCCFDDDQRTVCIPELDNITASTFQRQQTSAYYVITLKILHSSTLTYVGKLGIRNGTEIKFLNVNCILSTFSFLCKATNVH